MKPIILTATECILDPVQFAVQFTYYELLMCCLFPLE